MYLFKGICSLKFNNKNMNECLKPLLTSWEVDLGVEVACVVNLWEVGGMLYNYNQNSSNLIHLFLFIIKFITFKISYKLTLNLYTWLLTIIISYKVHWKVMNLSEWWGFVVNTHAWSTTNQKGNRSWCKK